MPSDDSMIIMHILISERLGYLFDCHLRSTSWRCLQFCYECCKFILRLLFFPPVLKFIQISYPSQSSTPRLLSGSSISLTDRTRTGSELESPHKLRLEHIAVDSAWCGVRTGCWTVRQERHPNMTSYVHSHSVSTKDLRFSGKGNQSI